jgi:8-oxo-dGTP pyrophosphatase MutT (NUDIX family)
VFLGLDGAVGVFAVDLSALPEERAVQAAGAERVLDVRRTLAGFVEIGESLEDAVRREVAEETGVPGHPLGRPDSIGRHLLNTWLAKSGTGSDEVAADDRHPARKLGVKANATKPSGRPAHAGNSGDHWQGR